MVVETFKMIKKMLEGREKVGKGTERRVDRIERRDELDIYVA